MLSSTRSTLPPRVTRFQILHSLPLSSSSRPLHTSLPHHSQSSLTGRRSPSRRFLRSLAALTGGVGVVVAGGLLYLYLHSGPIFPGSEDPTTRTRKPPAEANWKPPTRQETLNKLGEWDDQKRRWLPSNAENEDQIFDLLVIGGGATGAGVALDAASRGLKVALVERDDFGSGTSSKSTKLVHGGVRYLQKAVFELDYDQWKLVKEALHERRIFLQTAPYLSAMLPIMLPIYKYWQVPYYWAGCKLYDLLAGKENMETSYVMTKGKALEQFPMLKGDGLVGAVVYYDGQHNDSRMNIAIIMSAVKHGAVIANYTQVSKLHKDANGKLNGAKVRDTLTGRTCNVRARGVINATGPYTDTILTLDNPSHKRIVQPSSGVHITLPGYYSPRKMGLLDPATSDGRVIFFLPWEGNTIAGTTDAAAQVDVPIVTSKEKESEPEIRPRVWEDRERDEPKPSEDEIRWVLEEVRRYLSPDIRVRRGDVLSAWSGLRPLIRNPEVDANGSGGTKGLVRSHLVSVSPSGLVTIAGGKWTTYRKMAEECVDEAIKTLGLGSRVKTMGQGETGLGCVTEKLKLVGGEGWSRNAFIGLIQRFGIETEVAQHLSNNYGGRAWTVCALAGPTETSWPVHGVRLHPLYPFIEAEVLYAIRNEYAQTPLDILARRTRLAFLNSRAALEALPRVVEIMGDELGWGYAERRRMTVRAVRGLGSMGIVGVGRDEEQRAGKARGGLKALERIYNIRLDPKPRGVKDRMYKWSWGMWEDVRGYKSGSRLGLGTLGLFGSGSSSSSSSSSLSSGGGRDAPNVVLSRALFESGEVELLREAFGKSVAGRVGKVLKRDSETIANVLRTVAGYENVRKKDCEYVLQQAATTHASASPPSVDGDLPVDVEEFVEIAGDVKEVVQVQVYRKVGAGLKVTGNGKKVIPVEKSGGGV